MPYIDVDLLITRFGYDPDDELLLDDLIPIAQQVIDTRCGRTFEQPDAEVTHTYVKDNIDGDLLLLDDDLLSASEVKVDAVAQTDYALRPLNALPAYGLYRDDSGGWGTEVTVKGYWAYSATAPADIMQAALRLVQWFYGQQDNVDPGANRPIVTASGSVILPAQLPSDIETLLEKYVRG